MAVGGYRRRHLRMLGLVLAVVGAGFAVTALAVLGILALTDADASWGAIAAYGIGALATLAVTALVGWTVLEPAAPPAPAPAGDGAEASFEMQRRPVSYTHLTLPTM